MASTTVTLGSLANMPPHTNQRFQFSILNLYKSSHEKNKSNVINLNDGLQL
ncbi:hypothetical protein Hanom_Chr15g01353521 [Helianthus anomalus]